MRTNVIGRVQNTHLPKSQALLPLFEAVVNSIDAIDDKYESVTDGSIQIRILRDPRLDITESEEDKQKPGPVFGFEIIDDGVGFTHENYEAFDEADTQYKATRGGKGVGRFLWLKAFEKVEVYSTFFEDDHAKQRTFEFSLRSPEGILNHNVKDAESDESSGTSVRLIDYKQDYRNYLPLKGETIARRLLEHCLEYFVLGNMPKIEVVEEDSNDKVDLDHLYDGLVANNLPSEFDLNGKKFTIVHFFLHSTSGLTHHLSYCAHRRVVKEDSRLQTKIPNLTSTILGSEEDQSLIYAGYISGPYLDATVNPQRTDFNTVPDGTGLFPDELSWQDIERASLDQVREAISPYLDSIRTEKVRRISEFVAKKAPEYRHIIKNYPDRLDAIPPDSTGDKLDLELHQIDREIETELKIEALEILESEESFDLEKPLDEQLKNLERFWQEWNDLGKSRLAKYVVHRKFMLDFLEHELKRRDEGGYSLEDAIHKIIFPLRRTSDDITFDEHNLWIIDERLVYHEYLASDLPLSHAEDLETESLSRPDILALFDRPIAVVEEDAPYTSGVVLFEFKRPMRDDYSSGDNPIQQVLGYVEEIKTGKKTDKDGRPIRVHEATPFYCYIVADLTSNLEKQARYHNLRRTPDHSGYFGYNDEVGAYIEIMDFEKVLRDAKRRNRVLFDKLNLPDRPSEILLGNTE